MPVAKPSSNEFVRFGVYVLSHLGYLFKKASVNTKQKIISSIFKEKLVFEGERYRTPTLNRGLELITRSISNLEAIKTGNERQSLDCLDNVYRDYTFQQNGHSARCVRDYSTTSFVPTEPSSNRKLEKVVDALGREVNHTTNQILFHIYDDGSVEKKFIVE